MKIINRKLLFSGIFIGVFLILAYFVKVNVDSGANFEMYDSLLGIMIFHNFVVLIFYLIIVFLLIFLGLNKLKIR